MAGPEEYNYLELSSDPVKFEPVSKVTNVYYDETNKEVLSVRGGGALGIAIRGYSKNYTFRMEERGSITSLKCSPDHSVLAVQYTKTSIELLSFNGTEVGPGLVQDCKAKGAGIIGFFWPYMDDLVLVTNSSVELYLVAKEKVATKHLRSYNMSTLWYVWSSECSLLLLCLGNTSTASLFQPVSFYPGGSNKLYKFEAEFEASTIQGGSPFLPTERDVFIGILYSSIAICILRQPVSPTLPVHLDIYMQNSDKAFHRTHICHLDMTGRFAINIVDSLIVVHHQASKTSLLFDIQFGGEVRVNITYLYPIVVPQSIKAFYLEEPNSVHTSANQFVSLPCDLYSPTWVFFQPDIIIDACLGCMWKLTLSLPDLCKVMNDKLQLVDCLLRRRQAKQLVLYVVKEIIELQHLGSLSKVYDKLNIAYKHHLQKLFCSQLGESAGCLAPVRVCDNTSVVIEQADMYNSVFAPLLEKVELRYGDKEVNSTSSIEVMSSRIFIGVVLEYIRSLMASGIPVQHFLYELVINVLVQKKQFYQLHQLLQYHVLMDSKPLACLLLSLVGVYAAGEQLCLDMLHRLNVAHSEILEILLSHNRITSALKFARSVGLADSISARKYLDAALNLGDDEIFYSVFTFFALRNCKLRGSSAFAKGEHCNKYVEHYKKHFGELPDYSA